VQVYLVGDPQQLPATVISPRATAHGYNVSLFRRLQANGFPVQARARRSGRYGRGACVTGRVGRHVLGLEGTPCSL